MVWCGMQMQLGAATRRGNVPPVSENIAHFALSSAHYPLGFLFSISRQPTISPQPSNSTQHRPSLSFKATTSVEVLILSWSGVVVQLGAHCGTLWCHITALHITAHCSAVSWLSAVPYYGTDICNGSRKSGPSAKHKMCADQMCGSSLNVKVNHFCISGRYAPAKKCWKMRPWNGNLNFSS